MQDACIVTKHIRRRYCKCRKGCGWLCRQCGFQSRRLAHCYLLPFTFTFMCLQHFISHIQAIVYYINGNSLTIYDSNTNSKAFITLCKHIDSYIESIAFENKIYAMGECEVYEINIKSEQLLQKSLC